MVIPINWTELLSHHNLEAPGYQEAKAAAAVFQAEKKAAQKEQEKAKRERSGQKKLSRGRKR